MGGTAWASVAVFAVAYVLMATEKVHRVTAALGGAVVMLLIGATDAEHAFFSTHAGIDLPVHLTPFVVVLLVVFVGLCRVMFRGAFRYDPARAAEIAALDERAAIHDRRLLAISLTVLAAVTVAFVFHTALDLEPSVVAMVGGSSYSDCPDWTPARWPATSSGPRSSSSPASS